MNTTDKPTFQSKAAIFLSDVIPPFASPQQKLAMRLAFYGGSMTAYNLFAAALAERDTAAVAKLHGEIEACMSEAVREAMKPPLS